MLLFYAASFDIAYQKRTKGKWNIFIIQVKDTVHLEVFTFLKFVNSFPYSSYKTKGHESEAVRWCVGINGSLWELIVGSLDLMVSYGYKWFQVGINNFLLYFMVTSGTD